MRFGPGRVGSLKVACIPGTPLLEARLRDALGGPGGVVTYPDTTAALPGIVRGEVRCTVVAVDVGNILAALSTIRVLRQLVPSHPVFAWCDRHEITTHQLVDIALAGVAGVVLRNVDDSRHVFRRTLEAAAQRSHALEIETRLGPHIPEPMRPVFRFMLEHAHGPMDVDRIAAAFGITRQTLRNRLVHHRLPLPRTLMTWCRLLVAGSLLQESGHTLDTVALQLDFSSGHHLGTVLRRYAGAGIAEMRAECGVAEAVEAAFRHALMGRSPSDSESD